jgi:hydrogenase nickel incorporation protein HypA/HybF
VHELSIAQAVVSTVEQAVGGRRVLRVRVRIGPLAGVVPEALAFCWDVVTRGSALEGAALEVERVPLEVACSTCGHRRAVTAPPLAWSCPDCGRPALPLGDGRTLEVGEVEIDDETETVAARP